MSQAIATPAFAFDPSALKKKASTACQILSSFLINIVAKIAGSCERIPARAESSLIARSKKLSKRIIAGELRQRGVDQESIDLALEGISDENEYRTAFELGMRKLSTMSRLEPDVQIRRIESLLARKGFGYSTISRVMRELDLLN